VAAEGEVSAVVAVVMVVMAVMMVVAVVVVAVAAGVAEKSGGVEWCSGLMAARSRRGSSKPAVRQVLQICSGLVPVFVPLS
jgi:hypothetical protein